MVLISLPDTDSEKPVIGEQGRRLVFYLAMEEYVAGNLDRIVLSSNPDLSGKPLEAFFLWQVPPTVIFGRNQVMEAEVNLPFCHQKGIQLYRRKSGGGCVYSDWGNIMLSYITDSTQVAFTFDKFLQRLSLSLRRLGLAAERSGRNDIMINGKKVSGNAFYLMKKGSIVHGTLLFDSDFEVMTEAITPSREKIISKGVSSVREHVANVKEELPKPMGIEDFKRYLIGSFCDRKVTLSPQAVREIEKIENTYLDPAFLSGRNHTYSMVSRGEIEGAGELEVNMTLDGTTIESVDVKGDYFPLKGNLGELLTHALKGSRNDRTAVCAALQNLNLEDYVLGLTTERLIELIYNDNTIKTD